MSATRIDHPLTAATAERTDPRFAVETPTIVLAVGVYAAWIALTLRYGHWPLYVVAPLTTIVLTLHSSLQHEILHGHPTRSVALNRLIAIMPLSLWLPYDVYRQHHMTHHRDERLTDPYDDPESNYWSPQQWAPITPFMRAMIWIQQTLAGRIVIGSWWIIGRFWRTELRAMQRDPAIRAMWLEHLAWCVPVILWIQLVCHMPFWIYAVTMVIPSTAILLVRSFAEHRARHAVRQRTAVVEGSWILGPLFLFNNLHSLHHEYPSLAWYRLSARYRRERERLLAENGGLVYQTYFDVARRFMFRPHDSPAHPMGRVPLQAD